MATVKRKISKKATRLIVILSCVALVIAGVVLWLCLRPEQTPQGGNDPSKNEGGSTQTETVKTSPLPESTFVSSGRADGFSYDLYEDYAVVTGFDGLTAECKIPGLIEEKPVMAIKEGAFLNETLLTSVLLPDTLRKIGENAFYGCVSLAEISLPESLHTLGAYAFSACTSLEKATVNKGLQELGTHAFDDTPYLKNNQEDFMIVGDGLLLGYHGKGGSITLPSDVKKIVSLSACEMLTTVYVPVSVTEIGDYAFAGCSNVTSVIMPSSVVRVGEKAFSGCSSLLGLRLGDGVKEVGDGAFAFCDNLKTVNFPKAVEKIGNNLFELTDLIETIYVAPASFAEQHFMNTEYASLVIADEE